jgi:hypothetical protein
MGFTSQSVTFAFVASLLVGRCGVSGQLSATELYEGLRIAAPLCVDANPKSSKKTKKGKSLAPPGGHYSVVSGGLFELPSRAASALSDAWGEDGTDVAVLTQAYHQVKAAEHQARADNYKVCGTM